MDEQMAGLLGGQPLAQTAADERPPPLSMKVACEAVDCGALLEVRAMDRAAGEAAKLH